MWKESRPAVGALPVMSSMLLRKGNTHLQNHFVAVSLRKKENEKMFVYEVDSLQGNRKSAFCKIGYKQGADRV